MRASIIRKIIKQNELDCRDKAPLNSAAIIIVMLLPRKKDYSRVLHHYT